MLALSSSASCQWSYSELANRLSQERSKLASYRLVLHQHSVDNGKIPNCTLIHEFSSVGEYESVVYMARDRNDKIISWGLSGRTGDFKLFGARQEERGNGRLNFLPIDSKEEYKIRSFLDWRIVGFSFCGDIGSRFETVAKYISDWDKSPQDGTFFKTTKAGVIARNYDTEIEVEIKDGTRVTMFRHGLEGAKEKDKDYTEWNVKYAKKFGLTLPVEATVLCGQQEARLEFDWQSVNEPLDTAPRAVIERLVKLIPNATVAEPDK